MTPDSKFTGASVVVLANELVEGWNNITLTNPVSCQPGLYVVSVDVHATLSFSSISQVAPLATPSVLTLVAGSYSEVASSFPDIVYSNGNYPTAYFWLDVSFTPMY
jgi:hypothetical protein